MATCGVCGKKGEVAAGGGSTGIKREGKANECGVWPCVVCVVPSGLRVVKQFTCS